MRLGTNCLLSLYILPSFLPLLTLGVQGYCCILSRSMTHTHTHIGRTPVDREWVRRRAYTWQHTTLTADIHVPGGIQIRNPSKRAATDPCLRPRDHPTVFTAGNKYITSARHCRSV